MRTGTGRIPSELMGLLTALEIYPRFTVLDSYEHILCKELIATQVYFYAMFVNTTVTLVGAKPIRNRTH